MKFNVRARHGLLTGAILVASAIEIVRGYKVVVVVMSAVVFLVIGNGLIYFGGAKERNLRKRARRDFYAGL